MRITLCIYSLAQHASGGKYGCIEGGKFLSKKQSVADESQLSSAKKGSRNEYSGGRVKNKVKQLAVSKPYFS